MEWILLWLLFTVVVGIVAHNRGRSGIGWFLLSFFLISPLIGLILVLCLGSPKAQRLEQERREQEQRRHDQMMALLASKNQ